MTKIHITKLFSLRLWTMLFFVAALALGSLTLDTHAADKKKKGKKDSAPTPVVVETPIIVPAPPPTPQPANGSLFSEGASNANLLGDFKARRTGDLVFVDVVEASAASVSSGANRKRDSGTLGGIGTITGALPVPGAAIAGSIVGALGTRKFEGRGSTERQSDLRARIVARVVEVLPNGDLRVAAYKTVRINKETETLTLSGILRQRDVAADNSVPTTAVGELYVALNGKGVASADNAPGWLFRFFEKITPF